MSALNTVDSLISDARTLLLDKVRPYRYEDPELIVALNTSLLEARRLRADLFVTRYGNEVPFYGAVTSEPFCIEPQFRLAFVFGVCGHALARDQEDVQDARANTFRDIFHDLLVGVRPGRIAGGTPGPATVR